MDTVKGQRYNVIMSIIFDSPLISAIIPVYNVEAYLNRCVESLISQTYKNIEIILVDDGSSDSSSILCDEWSKKDPRIKVYHKINGGLSDARNFGFIRANGSYITYIDSDDFVAADYIDTLYNLIKNYAADIACVTHACVQTETDIQKPQTTEVPVFVMDGKKACEELFTTEKCSTMAWGKLYNRKIIEAYKQGFPVGRVYEDTPTICKFLYSAEKVACQNIPLYYYYRGNTNTITHSFSEKNLNDAVWSAIERARFFSSVNEPKLSAYAWNFAGGNLIKYLLKYPNCRKNWKPYVKQFKKESKSSFYFKLKLDLAYRIPVIYRMIKHLM